MAPELGGPGRACAGVKASARHARRAGTTGAGKASNPRYGATRCSSNFRKDWVMDASGSRSAVFPALLAVSATSWPSPSEARGPLHFCRCCHAMSQWGHAKSSCFLNHIAHFLAGQRRRVADVRQLH